MGLTIVHLLQTVDMSKVRSLPLSIFPEDAREPEHDEDLNHEQEDRIPVHSTTHLR